MNRRNFLGLIPASLTATAPKPKPFTPVPSENLSRIAKAWANTKHDIPAMQWVNEPQITAWSDSRSVIALTPNGIMPKA